MEQSSFVIKGTFVHTPTIEEFEIKPDSFLVVCNGVIEGIYPELLPDFYNLPLHDYHGKLIFPGMCDMHIHAPQYAFRGLGMNLEGKDWGTWFMRYAFPDESRYQDEAYATIAYQRFADDWMKTTTTRACVYGTLHRRATEILMEILERKGFCAYVGKVNMDRNSTPGLEETTEESIRETVAWLSETKAKFPHVLPIITPRYIPTCSDYLLSELGHMARNHRIPVQSHLSEGLDEIQWVHELRLDLSCYAEGYDKAGMLGEDIPSIMAHCVYPTDDEFDIMRSKKNLWIAHCPQSNISSSGGIAPVKKYLQAGLHVGLGTDMAGNCSLSMLRAITDTVHVSKARWAFLERKEDPSAERNIITLPNAFYLATKGGGSFWGNVGSFEKAYEFDAVILDDTRLKDYVQRSDRERLERLILMADDRDICAKFIAGRKVYERQ